MKKCFSNDIHGFSFAKVRGHLQTVIDIVNENSRKQSFDVSVNWKSWNKYIGAGPRVKIRAPKKVGSPFAFEYEFHTNAEWDYTVYSRVLELDRSPRELRGQDFIILPDFALSLGALITSPTAQGIYLRDHFRLGIANSLRPVFALSP